MCDWCKKETIGRPMVSGATLPMICENCGTPLGELNYKNLTEWACKWALENNFIDVSGEGE